MPEQEEVLTKGLNVRTTINLKMTEYAYGAIDKGMKLYQERNPKAQVLPEVALIAMEVKTGRIKVLIGGRDFASSPYNRATQAKRQPGSAFKPIIYLTALEEGMSPDMMLRDAPISYTDAAGNVWQPGNYNNEYFGDVTMRKALEHSLNAATIRLLEKVGVSRVIDQAKSLHINSNFAPNLSLALGSTEVSPLDLAGAYATIAREGKYIPPTAIRNIFTPQGEELYREPAEEQVIPQGTAYTLIDMMKGVVTARNRRQGGKNALFPCGKDRNDERLQGRLVRRFLSGPALPGLGWLRQGQRPRKERIGGYHGASHLDGIHVEGPSPLSERGFCPSRKGRGHKIRLPASGALALRLSRRASSLAINGARVAPSTGKARRASPS